ncbi:MAG TPA: C1 family peptidase [Thermotogota bacterium]|nr:C1 family peptidase [Thermotogota bacterium]HPJ88106.1 C1 family peptidase [Thermotogota bacterium]HPR96034.1 C1 family peptidase [Thermotogota bacterium]
MEKGFLNEEFLSKCSKSYSAESQNKLITNTIVKNGINNSAMNNDSVKAMYYEFSEEIDVGKVTHQKQSGRCWMFAALNTIRYAMSKELNMKDKDFELSQTYTMFWDKFEKANYFLEAIIDTMNEELDSRTVSWLLETPTNDGGQWDMFVALVEKHGLVPKYAMPETYHSSNSRYMNFIISTFLRDAAKILRDMNASSKTVDEIRAKKEDLLVNFYRVLCHFLGEPPKTFDFEYRTKDEFYTQEKDLSPIEFYQRYSPLRLSDYVSLINAPTADKPYNKTYTVKYLGSVAGVTNIHYLNLEIEELKELSIKQLQDGEPVWFGCDVGKFSDRDLGIMDDKLFEYDSILGTDIQLNKGDRLNYRGSVLTHAMTFTGVNLRDGSPTKWKVQNSWGEEPGNKGFFIMSDSWFDEYNYEVAIHKKYLSEELLKLYEQEPIVLNPWDPMGSLANCR